MPPEPGAAQPTPPLPRSLAAHGALIVAVWLAAIVLYSVTLAPAFEPLWVAIDLAIIAGCCVFIRSRRERLGFRALGDHRLCRLAVIVLVSVGCVLASQLVIPDQHAIWIDESHYLATVRAGAIVTDGLYPFNARWLEPFLAGALNVLPVSDADALKAINFGALVVTCVLLVLWLVRMRIPFGFALVAPVFLLSSYLGVYASANRLVLDPFNYALFMILLHTLLQRAHWRAFAVILLVTACNSEKAVYWIPVFSVVAFMHCTGSSSVRRWLEVARLTALHCGPTIVYLLGARVVLGANTETTVFLDNLHVMSLSHLGGHVSAAMKQNTFQMIWLPFGAFTIYALLGFAAAPRHAKPVALLLVPVLASTLIAYDTQRMVAYAFIVYLPFGYRYLARACSELPRELGIVLFGVTALVAVAEHYLQPLLVLVTSPGWVKATISSSGLKLVMSSVELCVAGCLLFVHLTFYSRRAS